jgi:predicted GIY-YIG superfamily endonuclease
MEHKTASKLIDRYLQGESVEEILEDYFADIDESVIRGTSFRPRKRRYGKRGKTINPYTGKRKDPKLRRIMKRAARKARVKRKQAVKRFNRSAKGKMFHRKLGKLVARIRKR